MDIQKIKLVIWDLDDTFWTGTLSEGDITFSAENIALVKQLVDCGIMNSICSKNDFDMVRQVLTEAGIWDYFVFPKISWMPKGEIIRDLIAEMNLRSCNVLFLDDNPGNLNEAKFYSPDLTVATPDAISGLIQQASLLPLSDVSHKRLAQYRILERKQVESKQASSNEEFLFSSNIRLQIKTDCQTHFQRIHELIMRTNQLNYTKVRSTPEELEDLLRDPAVSCGYVTVSDKFGDYGISGFFAVKEERLIHFLFSCRTMGMGVEQYVYEILGYPALTVSGNVAYQVSSTIGVPWINQADVDDSVSDGGTTVDTTNFHALIKGPCDMEQILGYLQSDNCFTAEFTYITPETGVSIESYNHTWQIVESITLSPEQKKTIIEELPFSSPEFFSDRFYSSENNMVFFSLFTDPNLGLYRRKTGEIVAFGEYTYDLTDRSNWAGYMDGSIFNANCKFDAQILRRFAENYKYIGRISPAQIVDNLRVIRSHMPAATQLVLFLGVEFPYPQNTKASCEDRHLFHRELNALVREWASGQTDVTLLEFGDYVKTPKEMLNNINHFIKPVYYQMAQRVIELIAQNSKNAVVTRRSWLYMMKTYFVQASPIFRYYLKLRTFCAKLLKR